MCIQLPIIVPTSKTMTFVWILRGLLIFEVAIAVCFFLSARYLDGVLETLLFVFGAIILFSRLSEGMTLLTILLLIFAYTSYAFWALMRIIFFYGDRELAHKKYDKLRPWQKDAFQVAMFTSAVWGVAFVLLLFIIFYQLRRTFLDSPAANDIEPYFGSPINPQPNQGAYVIIPQQDAASNGPSYLQRNVGGARGSGGAGAPGRSAGSGGSGYNFPSGGGHVLGSDSNA